MEFERKFLITRKDWDLLKEKCTEQTQIVQGFLISDELKSIRIRKEVSATRTEFLMIIKTRAFGTREEIDIEITQEKFARLLSLCEGRVISKTRNYIDSKEVKMCIVDEFEREMPPLHWCVEKNNLLVEIEFDTEKQMNEFKPPEFLINEVTNDHNFYNENLVSNDFDDLYDSDSI